MQILLVSQWSNVLIINFTYEKEELIVIYDYFNPDLGCFPVGCLRIFQ